MTEYIECRECTSPSCKGCNTYTLSLMLHHGKFDCLMDGNRSIHSADVVPVVHGRWVFGGDGCVVCSECDEEEPNDNHRNYCPNCGARMDGE